jgi:hypothetical protein
VSERSERQVTSSWSDAEVRLTAADGVAIGGVWRATPDGPPPAGVVLVPGSRHERDAYGSLPNALEEVGLGSLRIDVRGRGSSLGAVPFSRMAPMQRRAVRLDVAAAVEHAASLVRAPARLGLIVEQDTAANAVEAIADDERVTAVVVLSARRGGRLTAAVSRRPIAIFGLVSSEDRVGVRATADAYLASAEGPSRLEVFHGLGFGTTMFSSRQFEHPDAQPLETMIAVWLVAQFGTQPAG